MTSGPSLRDWVAGARPRTLGASVGPVLVGTAVAAAEGPVSWWRFAATLLVSVALQVGVNYANDYSDGIRGADTPERIGPTRLTATGLADPGQVKAAAALSFAVAAALGLAVALAVDWRLLLVGAASILAAVLYTGGPKPYGYRGLGELAVMVFFGVVATCGTAFVQLERIPAAAVVASIPVGLLIVAILIANNIRDIETDARAGKRTLAVILGRPATRALYVAVVAGAFIVVLALGAWERGALLALVCLPLTVTPVRLVLQREDGPGLIRALVTTSRLQIATAAALSLGIWLFSLV
jgi:1,4-dihydroxy-2-naphthoate polyprenyltransferase